MERDMKTKITVRPQNPNWYSRRSRFQKTRVYFSHPGETIMDNLMNRRNRPRDLYRQYLPEVATALDLPAGTKFAWSQKAGCNCGCSPGFICDYSYGKDVWVEFEQEALPPPVEVAVLQAPADAPVGATVPVLMGPPLNEN
jgi:hypothetical protein